MPKVDTSSTGMAFAVEGTAGTKATADYKGFQPNDIGAFGTAITTVTRDPISKRRQRQKGTITGLEANAGVPVDLTMDVLENWLESICGSTRKNKDVWRLESTGGVATDGSEVFNVKGGLIDAGSDAANKFAVNTTGNANLHPLFWTEGFKVASNNGLKVLNASVTGHASNVVGLSVANGSFEAGDEATTTGKISLCGFRFTQSAGTSSFIKTGTQASLATTTQFVTQAKRMLFPGQMVHFGSPLTPGGAIGNGRAPGGNDGIGFARFREYDGNNLVFDKLPADFTTINSLASNATFDIIFGDFVRNVAVDDDDYLEQTYTIELSSENLLTMGASAYEYARGCELNTFTMEFPLNDKSTANLEFLARDIDAASPDRADGSNSPDSPVYTEALNTVSDFGRLRIVGADENGLGSDFKNLTITVSHQLTPENVIGNLGAKYINRGNFIVDVEAEAIFSSSRVPAAIRDNTSMSLDLILGNNEGTVGFDVPGMALSGGERSFPTNAAVTISTTGASFEDDKFDASLMASLFPMELPRGLDC